MFSGICNPIFLSMCVGVADSIVSEGGSSGDTVPSSAGKPASALFLLTLLTTSGGKTMSDKITLPPT